MREALLTVAAATVAAITAGGGQREIPVWDGTLPPPESVLGNNCNVAAVSGLRRERRLLVRAGPGREYPAVASLRLGARVFVCNEATRPRRSGAREWLGVAFAASGRPCTGATAEGLDIRRSVRCRTGWISSEWVTVISG